MRPGTPSQGVLRPMAIERYQGSPGQEDPEAEKHYFQPVRTDPAAAAGIPRAKVGRQKAVRPALPEGH
jgi:hypothetical protein